MFLPYLSGWSPLSFWLVNNRRVSGAHVEASGPLLGCTVPSGTVITGHTHVLKIRGPVSKSRSIMSKLWLHMTACSKTSGAGESGDVRMSFLVSVLCHFGPVSPQLVQVPYEAKLA